MKGLKFAHRGYTLSVALALLAGALQTQAQIIPLSNNNASALLNAGSQSGMSNWTVDGQNQLSQQWFWYRVGTNNPESSIDTISGAIISGLDANHVTTTYFNGAFGVSVNYTLTGFSPGSGQSIMGEIISITNATASDLDFHFFQYSDFDLGGTPGGDTVQLVKGIDGLFKEADQTKGATFLHETVVTPHAPHGEAALFNSTLVKLNNGTADNLDDNAGPLTGDATWALQWDFLIPAGSSVGISKEKDLFVPEPSALSLISVGIIGLIARRRKNSK